MRDSPNYRPPSKINVLTSMIFMSEELVDFEETIKQVLDTIWKQNIPLLIFNDEEDISKILLELDKQLQERGLITEASQPYHFVEIGHDGDMLDGLLDIYLSSKVRSDEVTTTLLSSQQSKEGKFLSLVDLLTKEKFIIFHVNEHYLRLFFEGFKYAEGETLSNLSSRDVDITKQYDDLVRHLFNYSTIKKPDETRINVPLSRLCVEFLWKLSQAIVYLVSNQSKILILMNWRTYALLNTFKSEIWGYGLFRIFDLSESGLALIPRQALRLFLSSLKLPPDLPSQIIHNCDQKYPRWEVKWPSWEGSPNPQNIYQWQKYWLEQMNQFNVPELVENKLRNMFLQVGKPTDSIDALILELKGKNHSAYKETEEILLQLQVSGEVIGFILDTMTRGFGQNLRQPRELKDEIEVVEEDKVVDQVKVAIIGYVGVGKSTLLHALRGETTLLDSTFGVSANNLPPIFRNMNIVLWDLTGQSRFSILWAKMIANAQVVVIVTDSTLENVLRSKKLVSLVREEVPHAKIIAMANKQDVPTVLKPERVSEILGVPTDGISAIDSSTLDNLTHIENAILDALKRYSLVMYFRYVTTTIFDDECEMIDILQKLDSAASAQASLDINPLIKMKSILDMTFTREELRRWLQLYLEKIRITTESLNSLIMGLEKGLIEAQNEARRILSDQGVPDQIIEWIISRTSSESSLGSDTSL